MRLKKIMAGFMACATVMAAIPGMTAYAYSGDENVPATTAASTAETTAETKSETTEIIDISDEVEWNGNFTVDSDFEFSQEDIMGLMGLFLGSNGSMADNPIGTVHGVNSYLNVRDGAGTEYDVLMHLLNGQKVEVTGEEGDWYQITVPEQVGYVYKDYLNVSNINPDGSFNITIDQEALDGLMELAMSLFFKDTSTPPLTPDGNLTLLDDVGSATGAGKQFITLVTKAGNTFYLIIDRDDKGEENVHFLNLVDEADLFALLEEDQQAAYQKPAVTVPAEQTQPEVKDPADETADTEKETEVKTEKKGMSPMPILLVILLMAGAGGGYFYLQTRKKKTAEQQRPDPDADYSEDDDDEDVYEIPEDDDVDDTEADPEGDDDYAESYQPDEEEE